MKSAMILRWVLVVVIPVAIVIAYATIQHPQALSNGLGRAHVQSWQVSPLEYERKTTTDRLSHLEQESAPFDHVSFGPGTQSVAYRLPVSIIQAYSWPDGPLAVVTTRAVPPGSMRDVQELAMLDRGTLEPIHLPSVKDAPGYASINLLCGSSGVNPIACASDFSGHTYYYLVEPNRAIRMSAASGNPSDTYTLSSGEACSPGTDPRSTVAVWAARNGLSRRPLITKATLFAASGGLVEDSTLTFSTVRCSHLGSINILNIGDRTGGVVFRIAQGKPIVTTRGEVLTSGTRHILISREETSGDLIDYLEVYLI